MNDSEIQCNTQVLSEIKTNSVRRRITKELEKMYPLYDQIKVEINDQGKVEISVYEITAESQFHKYGFVLTEMYPFRTPAIFFQSRPYIDYLRLRDTRLLKQITGQNCLCCHSLNCGENWSPAMTLNSIIEEVRWTKQKRRLMLNKLFADVIKRKYLIDDVNLDSWLF